MRYRVLRGEGVAPSEFWTGSAWSEREADAQRYPTPAEARAVLEGDGAYVWPDTWARRGAADDDELEEMKLEPMTETRGPVRPLRDDFGWPTRRRGEF